jgi:CHAD domain-containing protein
VLKLVKRIAKLSVALTPDAQEERWHEVRIEGKKVRYLLEVFGDFFPKGRALKALAPLVRLQEALGDLNDNAMQRVFLRDSVWSRPLDGAGDELSRCLGGLEVLLEQRCKELRRAARRALERFRKSGARTVKGLG